MNLKTIVKQLFKLQNDKKSLEKDVNKENNFLQNKFDFKRDF